MSAQELAEDRAIVEALDAAVARFKAALGADDAEAGFRARQEVETAMLSCLFRAARLRGERARNREGGSGVCLPRN